MKQSPLVVFNYSMFNKDNDTVDIHIDGEIVDSATQQLMQAWWGDETSVSYRSFRNQIENANPKTINLKVNSPGGHVGDAMAMHDYLEELENKGVTVNRKGTGIVASAGTYLVMGNNSELSENCMFMVHNIQMMAYGDINQVESQVKAGRKFNDLVRDFYVNKTGKPAETISAWMNKETWFNAEDAKNNGFVKNVSGKSDIKNTIKKERWPYTNMEVLNTYNSYTKKSSKMKINIDALTTSLVNALKASGIVKNSADEKKLSEVGKELATAVSNAITAGDQEAIKTAVANYLKDNPGNKVDEASIQNAIDKELAKTGEGTVNQAIKDAVETQVTNATKDLPKKADIDKLQNSIDTLTTNVTEKLGGKAPEKEEATNEKERKVTSKTNFYKVGEYVKASN